MAVLTKHFVLSQQQTLDSTHQRTALAGQVGINLALESRFKQVTGTDTDTDGQRAVFGTTRCILVNGIRAVQSAALEEHRTQRRTRTLGSYHDDIDISRRDDVSAFLIRNSETMREVQSLARSQVLLDLGPYGNLGSIGQQHADDGTLLCSSSSEKSVSPGFQPSATAFS